MITGHGTSLQLLLPRPPPPPDLLRIVRWLSPSRMGKNMETWGKKTILLASNNPCWLENDHKLNMFFRNAAWIIWYHFEWWTYWYSTWFSTSLIGKRWSNPAVSGHPVMTVIDRSLSTRSIWAGSRGRKWHLMIFLRCTCNLVGGFNPSEKY